MIRSVKIAYLDGRQLSSDDIVVIEVNNGILNLLNRGIIPLSFTFASFNGQSVIDELGEATSHPFTLTNYECENDPNALWGKYGGAFIKQII